MASDKRRSTVRRRINVRGPVTLLFLVAVLAGAAWFGWRTVLSTAEPIARPGCSTPTPGTQQRAVAKNVTVNVYNAGTREGMATRTSRQLQAQGFTIGTVGNEPTDSRLAKTKTAAVRGRDKSAPEVALLAVQVKKSHPRIVADDRKKSSVDLVVGDGFKGLDKKAPKAVTVQSTAPICRTPSATPGS